MRQDKIKHLVVLSNGLPDFFLFPESSQTIPSTKLPCTDFGNYYSWHAKNINNVLPLPQARRITEKN